MDDEIVSKRKKSVIILPAFVLLIILGAYLGYQHFSSNTDDSTIADTTSTDSINDDREFIEAVIPIVDSTEQYVIVSSPDDLSVAIDNSAGKGVKQIYNGRRINIAVTGVDSRLGTNTRHADANHIISLLIDSGKVELFAIPRDTYVDCGYDDSTGLNKLTVLRAGAGRERYLCELARIARLDKIHYWVEFGFSQAMGLIELLGYSNPKATLRVLRSRKGLGGDDYQRVYNQSQFIRQSILRHFAKLDGQLGALLIRAGLALVETNLSFDVVNDLYKQMKDKGFPHSASDIKVFVRPPVPIDYKVYDFTDEETIAELRNKIDRFYRYNEANADSNDRNFVVNPLRVLQKAIASAAADTARNPQASINKLQTYFDQRSWYQIDDLDERTRVRNEMAEILIAAYHKRKKTDEANKIRNIIEIENKLLKNKQISDKYEESDNSPTR
ncbi:MAG: LCP family protein [Ignavibacteria bacterium]|nr:LCP family protein [Ignavibacteria bacterium]